MPLSRKHFQAIADIIQATTMNDQTRTDLIRSFSYYFRGENSRFDMGKFEQACQAVQTFPSKSWNIKTKQAPTKQPIEQAPDTPNPLAKKRGI